MNYLAHIYLAGEDPGLRVGGILGDFVKGPMSSLGHLPGSLQAGIWLHRQLDGWSVRAECFRQAERRLGSCNRRIAGVLVDLFCDHYLARSWSRQHSQPLALFSAGFYQDMASFEPWLNEASARWLAISREHDLLAGYSEFERLQPILARMDARRRRPLGLAAGFTALADNYAALLDDAERILVQAEREAVRLKQQLPKNPNVAQ